MALVLFLHENLGKDKHVESTNKELNLCFQRFFLFDNRFLPFYWRLNSILQQFFISLTVDLSQIY